MSSQDWPMRLALHEAAKRIRRTALPVPRAQRLSYTAAMQEAPGPSPRRISTTEDELRYRRAYADELVRAGVARALGDQSGRTSGPSGKSVAPRTTVQLSPVDREALAEVAAIDGATLGATAGRLAREELARRIRPEKAVENKST